MQLHACWSTVFRFLGLPIVEKVPFLTCYKDASRYALWPSIRAVDFSPEDPDDSRQKWLLFSPMKRFSVIHQSEEPCSKPSEGEESDEDDYDEDGYDNQEYVRKLDEGELGLWRSGDGLFVNVAGGGACKVEPKGGDGGDGRWPECVDLQRSYEGRTVDYFRVGTFSAQQGWAGGFFEDLFVPYDLAGTCEALQAALPSVTVSSLLFEYDEYDEEIEDPDYEFTLKDVDELEELGELGEQYLHL